MLSRFLFPAPSPSYTYDSYPGELIWIPHDLDYETCKPNRTLPAIMIKSPDARFLILYFHRNGEDIGHNYNFAKAMSCVLEVHVLLVEFPNYGICPGNCCEESLRRNAAASMRFVLEVLKWPLGDIIIMGCSIGASVAVQLASQHEGINGLVMISPFMTLHDVIQHYVGRIGPWMVDNFFEGNVFDNVLHMSRVRSPLLIVHGKRDDVVPCSHGEGLFAQCSVRRKMLVCPEEMRHNNDLLSSTELLIRPMLHFFDMPDYTFKDPSIPAEAFDKRYCPNYVCAAEALSTKHPLFGPVAVEEKSDPTHGPSWREDGHLTATEGDIDDVHQDSEVDLDERLVGQTSELHWTGCRQALPAMGKTTKAPEPKRPMTIVELQRRRQEKMRSAI